MAGGYVNGTYYPNAPAPPQLSRTSQLPPPPAGSGGFTGAPGAAGFQGGPAYKMPSNVASYYAANPDADVARSENAMNYQTQMGAQQDLMRQANAKQQMAESQFLLDKGYARTQAGNIFNAAISGLNNWQTFPGINLAQPPPQVPAPQAPSIAPINTAADTAQTAAFGKAKAQAGALGKSALEGLRANLADRGILGSGVEARGLVDRLAAATNPLSDLNVGALQENVNIAQHNQDLGQQSALTGYQGGITQRGQNIQEQEDAAQLALSQQQLRQQQLTAALQGLFRLY